MTSRQMSKDSERMQEDSRGKKFLVLHEKALERGMLVLMRYPHVHTIFSWSLAMKCIFDSLEDSVMFGVICVIAFLYLFLIETRKIPPESDLFFLWDILERFLVFAWILRISLLFDHLPLHWVIQSVQQDSQDHHRSLILPIWCVGVCIYEDSFELSS